MAGYCFWWILAAAQPAHCVNQWGVAMRKSHWQALYTNCVSASSGLFAQSQTAENPGDRSHAAPIKTHRTTSSVRSKLPHLHCLPNVVAGAASGGSRGRVLLATRCVCGCRSGARRRVTALSACALLALFRGRGGIAVAVAPVSTGALLAAVLAVRNVPAAALEVNRRSAEQTRDIAAVANRAVGRGRGGKGLDRFELGAAISARKFIQWHFCYSTVEPKTRAAEIWHVSIQRTLCRSSALHTILDVWIAVATANKMAQQSSVQVYAPVHRLSNRAC